MAGPCFARIAMYRKWHGIPFPMKTPGLKTQKRYLKAMKAMKAMKKKTISKIAKGKRARASVFLGDKEKTYTGLKKSDLMKSKTGKKNEGRRWKFKR